jgi:hypothetical protein
MNSKRLLLTPVKATSLLVLFIIKKYPADIGALGGIKRIRGFSMLISEAYTLVAVNTKSIKYKKYFIIFFLFYLYLFIERLPYKWNSYFLKIYFYVRTGGALIESLFLKFKDVSEFL